MFISSKPLASLSSGLLARKGSARPAMRPQAYATLSSMTPSDDLGWNDMGADPAPPPELPPVLVERAALQDEVEHRGTAPDVAQAADQPVAVDPEVMATMAEAIAEPVTVKVEVAPLAPAALPTPRSAAQGKAAFTLRLDGRRHLRLRLASAVTHRSSQALLTTALDTFLATLPEVEELAAQCSSPAPLGDPQ